MRQRLAALLACLGLAGGAHAATSSGDPPATLDERQDIVLAVDNPLAPPPPHAGTNLLGYATGKSYSTGRQALATLAALKRRYGLRERVAWPIKPLGLYCVVLQPPPGVSREALLGALAADTRVRLVQPLQDFNVYASPEPPRGQRYNDPYVGLQRGFIATDAALAQARAQGQGVEVAIVDTGVDTAHPDLRGRIRAAQDMVGAGDGGASAFARDPHGTEVAGIIAAAGNNRLGIVGMAPQSVLSIYRACWYPPQPDGRARCNSFTLARALSAIADSRARIVNLSLGGPDDPLLRRLLEQLLSEGRIVVAAMPPDGRVAGFPADIPGVIVVRSSAAGTAPAGVLDAPGADILTTQPAGGYDFASGSSMATAHVSGIAALLLSVAPALDAQALQALMRRTSKPSDGVLQVNAAAALDALDGTGKGVR